MDEETILLIGAAAILFFPTITRLNQTAGKALNVVDKGVNAIDYVVSGPQYPSNSEHSSANLFDFSSWAVNQPGYWKGFLGW